MVILKALVYSLLLLISSECTIASNSTDTLRMVHVLFRHGDRAPVELYPNDPWKNKFSEIWPEGLKQLTKTGKAMGFELGLWLRKRYGSFIKKRFDPDEFNVVSTDVDRTLMSAECVVSAFYRPDNETKFRDDLSWAPTPIHFAPDGLLNLIPACPRMLNEFHKLYTLPEIKSVNDKNKEFYKLLSEKSGFNITTMSRYFVYLHDAISVEKLYNLTIPDWAAESLGELDNLLELFMKMFSYNHELKRLRSGKLLSAMAENMKNKANDNSKRKMMMYSGHDITVSSLLYAMGIHNNIRPSYFATVIVELHQTDIDYFVKTFYQNDTNFVNPPHEMVIPGCSEECPLSKWIELLRDIMITQEEYDKECNRPDLSLDHQNGSNLKENSNRSIDTDVKKGNSEELILQEVCPRFSFT